MKLLQAFTFACGMQELDALYRPNPMPAGPYKYSLTASDYLRQRVNENGRINIGGTYTINPKYQFQQKFLQTPTKTIYRHPNLDNQDDPSFIPSNRVSTAKTYKKPTGIRYRNDPHTAYTFNRNRQNPGWYNPKNSYSAWKNSIKSNGADLIDEDPKQPSSWTSVVSEPVQIIQDDDFLPVEETTPQSIFILEEEVEEEGSGQDLDFQISLENETEILNLDQNTGIAVDNFADTSDFDIETFVEESLINCLESETYNKVTKKCEEKCKSEDNLVWDTDYKRCVIKNSVATVANTGYSTNANSYNKIGITSDQYLNQNRGNNYLSFMSDFIYQDAPEYNPNPNPLPKYNNPKGPRYWDSETGSYQNCEYGEFFNWRTRKCQTKSNTGYRWSWFG